MSQYCMRILNHTVIGFPYVPICKFQISSTTKSKNDKTQQSPYINPPLYNPKLDAKDKQPVSTPSFDSSYMKQFPIEFSLLTFNKLQELEIRLIQLTRTGREKQIGYSKITLNAEVLGKNTKHKIIQIGQESKVSKQGVKNQKVISIVDVSFVVFKPTETSDGKIVKQQGVVNPFKIEDNNTSIDDSSLENELKKSKNTDQQNNIVDYSNSEVENQRAIFETSKQYLNYQIQNDTHSLFQPPKIEESNIESLLTINQPKSQSPNHNSSRRILHHKPSDSSAESSYPISRQSRVYSNNRMTGKIVRQKPSEKKNVQPIAEVPVNRETEFKHKRRLKYIFSTSEFGSVAQSMVENYRKESLKQNQAQKEYEMENKRRKKYLERMHTDANNQKITTQLVQYFISNDETDQNGYNTLTNLNFVYESAFGPFYPKYITFLTYKLYENIMRINCVQLKDQSKTSNQLKEEEKYLLQTKQGQLYEPEVCNKYSDLQLYLPKYCLMMRVQVIMEDETVYVGTLANQCDINIKSTLQLKKTNSMQNVQTKRQKQQINMIVNISERIVSKQIIKTPRIEVADVSLPTLNTAKNLNKQKSRFVDQRFFPQVARRLRTEQHKANAYLNYSTLNQDKPRKEVSPVQRTLNAINSYKNILIPKNQTETSIENTSQEHNKFQRRQRMNSYDRYLVLKKDLYSKTKQIMSQESHEENTLEPKQRPHEEPTQEQIAQILTSKRTYHKDLPKILVQRSSKNNLIEARKQALLQNIQSQIAIKTRKTKKSTEQKESLQDNIRLEYFKKVLNNKYSQYLSGNRQSQKKLINFEKKTHKSRSRICLEQQMKEQRRRKNKLMRLPYNDFSYTKIFPSNLNRSTIKMASCHQKCVQQTPLTKQLKEKKKKHMKSNSSLKTLGDKTKSQLKKGGRFNISIKRIDYLKLVEKGEEGKIMTKKFRSPGEDSQNQRWQESEQEHKEPEFQIFLKLYKESKKQTQLVTSSQKLAHAFSRDQSPTFKLLSPSHKSLNYLTTTWSLKDSEFMFKNIKVSDMITVEAYGDLSTVDNHEFMGRCIFTVQEMSYMRIQRKITGYLVRNKKIESHCTLHFDIEEVI